MVNSLAILCSDDVPGMVCNRRNRSANENNVYKIISDCA